MKMQEVSVGAMVFMKEKLDDEIRETYYTKVSDTEYLHHGCIQGSPIQEIGQGPRYSNIHSNGYLYTFNRHLPVEPIEASIFM